MGLLSEQRNLQSDLLFVSSLNSWQATSEKGWGGGGFGFCLVFVVVVGFFFLIALCEILSYCLKDYLTANF